MPLILTGNGEAPESEPGVAASGLNGNQALAAARPPVKYEDDADKLCRKAMKIDAAVCVYINDRVTIATRRSTM